MMHRENRGTDRLRETRIGFLGWSNTRGFLSNPLGFLGLFWDYMAAKEKGPTGKYL